tara:strand:+ start:196 stop:756 length:561 start_codon:yes stop_codon:yes gene_type:complete
MKKIIYILILNLVLSFSVYASTYSFKQINELNKLFSKLGKIDNIEDADILEKKIWAVWNRHPKKNKLTEKLELGTMLMYQGRYDFALRVFTNVIDSDPKWSEAWNKRATLLFFMKDYEKSLNDIDKVLNLEPRHFGALTGRAQIYIELELYQKAINDLKQARKIHPVIRGNILIKRLENFLNGQEV